MFKCFIKVSLSESHKCSVCYFQESPTGELVDYGFSTGEESNEQEASEEITSENQLQAEPETQVEVDARSCETFCVSDKADENSEDGKSVRTNQFFADLTWSTLHSGLNTYCKMCRAQVSGKTTF